MKPEHVFDRASLLCYIRTNEGLIWIRQGTQNLPLNFWPKQVWGEYVVHALEEYMRNNSNVPRTHYGKEPPANPNTFARSAAPANDPAMLL